MHPLPFCPEFYGLEFKSEVADMKVNALMAPSAPQSSLPSPFLSPMPSPCPSLYRIVWRAEPTLSHRVLVSSFVVI